MERLTFSDAGPADWPYLLCLWWRNVRATHGFVAEDYLRAIGGCFAGRLSSGHGARTSGLAGGRAR